MPSFRDRRSGLEVIGELLDIEFAQGIYTDSASLRELIRDAADRGFEVAVGGLSTKRYALETGLHFCELVSSAEEVAEAIENARSVAQSQRERRAAATRYQTVMDAASDGIVGMDMDGNITTLNQAARQMLGLSADDPTGTPISRLLPQLAVERVLATRRPVRDKIVEIEGELYVFNHLPVMVGTEAVGVVSSFRPAAHIIRTGNKVRRSMTKGFVARYVIEDLIYRDPAMEKIANICREFSRTDSCILITGETGTGKEILAQSIHNLSRRRTRPFVSVHCAALSEQLLESELFGYEDGAFTGSKKGGKPGLFELAHQGTIFLDEIDSTSMNVQLHLLRVLQEKEVMRVGAISTIPVDVRVIAAAGRELWEAVQAGTFRKDLFFRLNVLRIAIPPLRARRMDVPELLRYFLDQYARSYGLRPPSLPVSYIDALMAYAWPGNVRQVKHFAEQLVLNCNLHCGDETLDTLLSELCRIVEPHTAPRSTDPKPVTALPTRSPALDDDRILEALQQARFNKTRAAKILGVGRTTLWRRLKERNLA